MFDWSAQFTHDIYILKMLKEHTEYNVNVWKFNFDDWMKLITPIHRHKTLTGLWFLLLFNPKLGNAYYLIQPWCCKLRTWTSVQ